MRDIRRIQPTIGIIRDLWYLNPDMRLGQLLENLAGLEKRDLFYVEDDVLVEQVRRVLREGWTRDAT